jgi:hypothetical protein
VNAACGTISDMETQCVSFGDKLQMLRGTKYQAVRAATGISRQVGLEFMRKNV